MISFSFTKITAWPLEFISDHHQYIEQLNLSVFDSVVSCFSLFKPYLFDDA